MGSRSRERSRRVDRALVQGESAISAAAEHPSRKVSSAPPVLSPAANACAGWFRKLARALKVCRLYRTQNAVVVQARDKVLETLAGMVAEQAGITLRFTPSEIYLEDETVVRPRPPASGEESGGQSGE